MFVFIWQGRGFIVLLLGIAAVILDSLIAEVLGLRTSADTLTQNLLFFAITLLFFVPLWFYGRKRNVSRKLQDTQTGQMVTLQTRDSLFWIPLQYWGLIVPAFVLISIVVSVFASS